MGLLSDATFSFDCPNCGKEVEKTGAWLESDPDSFVCPHCGERIDVDLQGGANLKEASDTIDKAVEDLGRTFDNLNKRMKGR